MFLSPPPLRAQRLRQRRSRTSRSRKREKRETHRYHSRNKADLLGGERSRQAGHVDAAASAGRAQPAPAVVVGPAGARDRRRAQNPVDDARVLVHEGPARVAPAPGDPSDLDARRDQRPRRGPPRVVQARGVSEVGARAPFEPRVHLREPGAVVGDRRREVVGPDGADRQAGGVVEVGVGRGRDEDERAVGDAEALAEVDQGDGRARGPEDAVGRA